MSQECNDNTCCTTNDETQCDSAGEECCTMHETLLELADEAWYEAVKDRIRKEIDASCGEKLDELAKIVTEANQCRWQHKIGGKVKENAYKTRIREFFESASCG